MENNHDKNTQQHSSYFHNGKEYKDIFEAAEAYLQEVLNQGKEDVNTQSPPSQNKTQTALTHPHHKIKKVRSFLCGLLFGALISGISASILIFGFSLYIDEISNMLVVLEILYFIIKITKKISKKADELSKKLGIERKIRFFCGSIIFGIFILGVALALWIFGIKTILIEPVAILFTTPMTTSVIFLAILPFFIKPFIFLTRIIIRILKKINNILKKFGMERQAHLLFAGLLLIGGILLGTTATAIVIKLGVNNSLNIIQHHLGYLAIIGLVQTIIEAGITYWAKFKKMRKKDKIIDIIGFGSIFLYVFTQIWLSDLKIPYYLK